MCFNMEERSRVLNLVVITLAYCTVWDSKTATLIICQK